LLAAFDEATLRSMVRIQLDADLDAVAGGKNLAERVYSLVAWADREGRVLEIIDGAVAQNPGNTALQALKRDAADWHLEPAEEGEPPYQGLQYFDVRDAGRFFGREQLTAELVGYLHHHRLLAVIGASGSGKSSVVRAGMVPVLQGDKPLADGSLPPKGSERWLVHILTPTAHPLESLATQLVPKGSRLTAITDLMDDLAGDDRCLHLYIRQLLADDKTHDHLLLVVDQFEELFTLCKDKDEQGAFVNNLLTAASPDGVTTVILTLRADFYAHCSDYANLRAALESSQRYIGAMSQDELRTAIEAPAEQGGWSLEPGLVNEMLDDMAGEPGALPLLSHALLETWKRRSGRMLTFAGYHAAGGVKGAIAHTADSVYGELSPDEQAIARNIFLRLTELGEGVQDTRRRVPLSELVPRSETATVVEGVLKRLQDERLVTTEREQVIGGVDAAITEASIYVDVTHEALIREWPALREWLAEDREGLRTHRRLTDSVKEWERLNRDPSVLYRGLRLEQTLAWAADHQADLNEQERTFLAESQAAVDAERQERSRIEREREEARLHELESARVLAAAAEAQRQAEAQRAEEAEARQMAEAARAEEAESRRNAEEERAREAEARLKAEADRVKEAEARQDVEKKRAQEAEQASRSSRRLAWGLGIALWATIIAAGATYYFFVQAQNSADQAQELASAMGDLLGLELGSDLSNVRRQVATLLVQRGEAFAVAGDRKQAEENFETALSLNPPSDTPVYVWISEGEFIMGSSDKDKQADNDEKPPHTVYVDGFWIMRTEVTNEQYKRCVDAGVCEKPTNERWYLGEYAREPVTDVNWNQATEYTVWVGGRLPTEAEWEKACRGPDGALYPWGDESPDAARANYGESGQNGVDSVGIYPSGANGLYDMAGNAWEWTADWYAEDYYAISPSFNPTGPADSAYRTLRGGSWNFDAWGVRCMYRGRSSPDYRSDDFGFRVVSPGS